MIDVCQDCGAFESFKLQTIQTVLRGEEPVTEMTCQQCGGGEAGLRQYVEEDIERED